MTMAFAELGTIPGLLRYQSRSVDVFLFRISRTRSLLQIGDPQL